VTLNLTAAGRELLREDPVSTLPAAAVTLPTGARNEIADGLSAVLRQHLERCQQLAFGPCRTCR